MQVFLDHRPREEVSRLVSAKTNGATPLVLSCRNGHHDVVEYLVDKCCASVEQPGSVPFDGETIEGAPPLWCAAAAGIQTNIFSKYFLLMQYSFSVRSFGHCEAVGEERSKCKFHHKN